MCGAHYQRSRKGMPMDVPIIRKPRRPQPETCEAPGCDVPPSDGRRMCGAHRKRISRGIPLDAPLTRKPRGILPVDRVFLRVAWEGDCLVFTGARTGKMGYGNIAGRNASRVVWEYLHPGESCAVVRHTCDNPPCVNPDHLIGGTYADNVRDMYDRGRQNPRWKRKH